MSEALSVGYFDLTSDWPTSLRPLDSLTTHLTTLHFPYWWVHREKHFRAKLLTNSGSTLEKCISRESNPGHIDGNDVFYH